MRPGLEWLLALLLLVIHLLVGSESSRRSSNRYAGPYRIKLTDVFRCNQSEPLIIDPFFECNERNKTHNECHHVHGNITFNRDFTNGKPYPAVLTLNQWRDKEWKRDGVVMKFPDGVLAFRTHMPDIHRSIFKDDVLPKKKVYDVDIPIRIDIKAIPVFPYGRWKGNMQLAEKHVAPLLFCLNVVVDIVPK